MQSIHYPAQYLQAITHAIEAHSFSADIPAETIEARVVQDADRMDALGAVGLARCFMVSVQMETPLYSDEDPFCQDRSPEDSEFTIDHFYIKLFKIADTLMTPSAKQEGQRRVNVMKQFLQDLSKEII